MTDLRDVLLSLADPPLLPPEPAGELEHRQLRRKRRKAARAAAVAAGLSLVAGATLVSVGSSGEDGTRIAAGPPVTTAAVPPVPTPPFTLPPARPDLTGTCRNTHDPACGPFRWDPEPVETPVTVQVTAEPSVVRVGDEVVFRVEASSPVSSPWQLAARSGDGGRLVPDYFQACAQPGLAERFGVWDLPPPQPDDYTTTYRWAYDRPGTYMAVFTFGHGTCNAQQHPQYPGTGQAAVTVTVVP